MTNKLPPLPPIPFVQIEDALVAWATEYGQQCRDAALEEAVSACVAIAVAPSNVVLGVAITCADKIRGLK